MIPKSLTEVSNKHHHISLRPLRSQLRQRISQFRSTRHHTHQHSRQTAQTDRRVEIDRKTHVVAVVAREHPHQLVAQFRRLEATVQLLQPQQVRQLQ